MDITPVMLDENAEIRKALRLKAASADLDGQRGDIARRNIQVVEPPARQRIGIVVDCQQGGRSARFQRNRESIQRVGEPLAESLDIGLLAGPAIEEGFGLRFGGERTKRLDLPPGEEAFGDLQ